MNTTPYKEHDLEYNNGLSFDGAIRKPIEFEAEMRKEEERLEKIREGKEKERKQLEAELAILEKIQLPLPEGTIFLANGTCVKLVRQLVYDRYIYDKKSTCKGCFFNKETIDCLGQGFAHCEVHECTLQDEVLAQKLKGESKYCIGFQLREVEKPEQKNLQSRVRRVLINGGYAQGRWSREHGFHISSIDVAKLMSATDEELLRCDACGNVCLAYINRFRDILKEIIDP